VQIVKEVWKSKKVNAVCSTNFEPFVAEVVAHDAGADLQEHVLNPYFERDVVDDGGLIVSRANVFGPAAKFATLVVAALPAHFISIAEVFFPQAVHNLILLDGGG
jgi:hypothetical protein